MGATQQGGQVKLWTYVDEGRFDVEVRAILAADVGEATKVLASERGFSSMSDAGLRRLQSDLVEVDMTDTTPRAIISYTHESDPHSDY